MSTPEHRQTALIFTLGALFFMVMSCGGGETDSSGGHVDRNCADFPTQTAAQEYFDANGGSPSNNFDGLDADHDGIPCEHLP